MFIQCRTGHKWFAIHFSVLQWQDFKPQVTFDTLDTFRYTESMESLFYSFLSTILSFVTDPFDGNTEI